MKVWATMLLIAVVTLFSIWFNSYLQRSGGLWKTDDGFRIGRQGTVRITFSGTGGATLFTQAFETPLEYRFKDHPELFERPTSIRATLEDGSTKTLEW